MADTGHFKYTAKGDQAAVIEFLEDAKIAKISNGPLVLPYFCLYFVCFIPRDKENVPKNGEKKIQKATC